MKKFWIKKLVVREESANEVFTRTLQELFAWYLRERRSEDVKRGLANAKRQKS